VSAAPLDSWDKAAAFALGLPGTKLTTGWMDAVVLESNGRAVVFAGREAGTSFAVMIDLGTVDMLKETEPETYWQSRHYEGYPAVLVRYDSPDPERVRRVIEQAYEQAALLKPKRKRKPKA
jgi:hypothetical protein